jgi:hypothetical protein
MLEQPTSQKQRGLRFGLLTSWVLGALLFGRVGCSSISHRDVLDFKD